MFINTLNIFLNWVNDITAVNYADTSVPFYCGNNMQMVNFYKILLINDYIRIEFGQCLLYIDDLFPYDSGCCDEQIIYKFM